MNTQEIIVVAEKHMHINDSAKLCVQDAKWCLDREDDKHARERALRSLEHSVGVFHEDYKVASGNA
jgi:hypothetical protein